MKKTVFSFLAVLTAVSLGAFECRAQETDLWDSSTIFATRDTVDLVLDFYYPEHDVRSDTLRPCIIHVYGGGFAISTQRHEVNASFCRRMADEGYVAIAADYRLGLKDYRGGSMLKMIEPVRNSITMATEDLFAALEYVLSHAGELNVDPGRIIVSGSSAGAITVLQANYELSNRTAMTSAIPGDFRFAGVISFAGGIFSDKGKCKFKVHEPAPTFFLHGDADRLVPYNQIKLFNLGMYGSKPLSAIYREEGYLYCFASFQNHSHEVATFMTEKFDEVMWFIHNYVDAGKNWQIDIDVNDADHQIGRVYSKPQDAYDGSF